MVACTVLARCGQRSSRWRRTIPEYSNGRETGLRFLTVRVRISPLGPIPSWRNGRRTGVRSQGSRFESARGDHRPVAQLGRGMRLRSAAVRVRIPLGRPYKPISGRSPKAGGNRLKNDTVLVRIRPPGPISTEARLHLKPNTTRLMGVSEAAWLCGRIANRHSALP